MRFKRAIIRSLSLIGFIPQKAHKALRKVSGAFGDFIKSPIESLVDFFDIESNSERRKKSMQSYKELKEEDEDEDVHFDVNEVADDNETEDKKKESRRIVKNLLVITVVFLLVFLAYNGLANLQSSLHREHGLGTLTQSITYISYFVSSLLLPRLFIAKLGQKWTIIICSMGYMTWMAANGYAVWLTLGPTSAIVGICAGPLHTARAFYLTKYAALYAKINGENTLDTIARFCSIFGALASVLWLTLGPTSAIVGICAGPLWTAQSSYITKYAGLYATIKGERTQDVIARFFGIFGTIFSISKVISSLIGAVILTPHVANANETLFVASEEDLQFCGANDCPGSRNTSHNLNYHKVEPAILWTLVAVYLACATVGLIIAYFFLDPVPEDLQDAIKNRSSVWRETLELATATMRMNLKPQQILLIPFIMVPGLDFAFYFADWPMSYITCALGISYVGWTTFPQGAMSSLGAYIGGVLTKRTGRIPLIVTGMLLLCCVNLLQLWWQPHPDHMFNFYFVPIVYGLSSIGGPAKDALLGTEFKEDMDATFSNIHMWGSLGGTIAFAYSNVLCTRTKLYIILSLMLVGTLGYCVAEVLFTRRRNKQVLQKQVEEENDDTDEDMQSLIRGEEVRSVDVQNKVHGDDGIDWNADDEAWDPAD